MVEDNCQVFCFNPEATSQVKENMLQDQEILKLSQTFKVLGDPTRVKILYALSQLELCVCDLATVLGMSQSAISHQLRVLRTTNLVKFRKEGLMVYYSLDDGHILGLFEQGLEHVRHAAE
ncbi:MAG TPA: metalloregulator ArsR/SmtB family transcription factor [Candidatus Deferrimicrobium sp.]|nr:metalloregulator ArsR/SmtB family transcription factor [Candidatus Deferrimicrobium sp.]